MAALASSALTAACPPDETAPATMRAWVLNSPDELELVTKPAPSPGVAEVLVRIDAVAVCATDLEVISQGPPALVNGG
ncbi:MAG: hypothetical protein ACYC8V_02595, partial [Caulobacteraceae bacterium]